MPRRRNYYQTIQREIYLPLNISAILESLFLDPVKGRARYNAINTYINSLIIDDLKRRGIPTDPGAKQLDSPGPADYNDGSIGEITGAKP